MCTVSAFHHLNTLAQVWQTIISVGYREPLVYKYAIVDDDNVVLLSETCTRRVVFPPRLAEDSVVKVCDVWQVIGIIQTRVTLFASKRRVRIHCVAHPLC